MAFTPLPLFDDFVAQYHVGHVLVLLLALSVVGSIPVGSRKVLRSRTGSRVSRWS
jgi:hypothetical protein